jgi:hypothetical protein
LKAKLNGAASSVAAAAGSSLFGNAAVVVGSGAASNGLGSSGHTVVVDNCDTMSLNGSLVSNNGSVINVVSNGGGMASANSHHLTNGSGVNNGGLHANGGSVHVNGLATLPLVRPNTGESSSRTSTLESPSHEGSLQNGK